MVFASTTVVTGTASATEFNKITSLTKNVRKQLTPMQREVIHLAPTMMVIAKVYRGVAFFGLGLFFGKGQRQDHKRPAALWLPSD